MNFLRFLLFLVFCEVRLGEVGLVGGGLRCFRVEKRCLAVVVAAVAGYVVGERGVFRGV